MRKRKEVRLVIVGASGHGRVVMDLALASGLAVAGFVDRRLKVGERIHGHPVLAHEPEECPALSEGKTDWFIAVGDNAVRHDLWERMGRLTGRSPIQLVHPTAIISPTVELGPGVFVGPRAVVNVDGRLGEGVILNTASVVDHDGDVGSFAQISPGCHLAGNVTVGKEAFLGTGTSVIPGITIGAGAVGGAGAVVVRDVPPSVVAYGNPARVRRDA